MMKKYGKKCIISLLTAAMLFCTACGKEKEGDKQNNGAAENVGAGDVVGNNSEGDTNKTQSETGKEEAVSENALDFTDFYVSADMISVNARDTNTSSENAVSIVLSGTDAKSDSSAVKISGTTVTITAAGTYLVSGTLTDGELVIDTEKENEVHLIFDGVNITNADGPAVYAKHGLITITLKDGTTSTLTDGAEATIPEGETEPVGACLYSKDDLSLNGEGTLVVQAKYKDGINCKDVLKLVSGHYEITAADDGIVGKDAVWVLGGTGSITAGGDGIKSTNVEKEESGYLYVENGSYTLVAGADGLQADSSMLIAGGNLNVTTGGGSQNAAPHSESMGFWGRGDWYNDSDTDDATDDASGSMKGIKVDANLVITGGTIVADCADDTLHSNGTITLQGGMLTLTAGDDGIHAEEAVTIDDGTITIIKSYEGIEARVITINGGTTRLTASDDGVNATAGSTSMNQGMGGGMFDVQDATFIVTNGYIYMNADGDGLDSNGTVSISGGVCIVDGPTNGGNGALDYGSTCEVTGGVLIAAGASGMAMNPTAGGQGFASMTYSSMQTAGNALVLTDTNGKVIAAYTPAKSFSHVVISAPGLTEGTTLRLYTGGTLLGTNQEGYYQSDATYTAGTLIAEFAVSGTGNYFNENGVTTGNSGGFGNIGGGGGMGGMGGFGGGRGDKKNQWNQNGEMPNGERPEMPNGEMPQMPNGEMPQMPNGEMPQMPNGEMPQMPGTDAENGTAFGENQA